MKTPHTPKAQPTEYSDGQGRLSIHLQCPLAGLGLTPMNGHLSNGGADHGPVGLNVPRVPRNKHFLFIYDHC